VFDHARAFTVSTASFFQRASLIVTAAHSTISIIDHRFRIPQATGAACPLPSPCAPVFTTFHLPPSAACAWRHQRLSPQSTALVLHTDRTFAFIARAKAAPDLCLYSSRSLTLSRRRTALLSSAGSFLICVQRYFVYSSAFKEFSRVLFLNSTHDRFSVKSPSSKARFFRCRCGHFKGTGRLHRQRPGCRSLCLPDAVACHRCLRRCSACRPAVVITADNAALFFRRVLSFDKSRFFIIIISTDTTVCHLFRFFSVAIVFARGLVYSLPGLNRLASRVTLKHQR